MLPGGTAAPHSMFYPPANAPHAAVAYRTTALDARRQERAGGPGDFFFLKF
jgi:hypothetical protein